MIGKRLAHYEISAELGKGGMGEVYRARDTKLDRDVAIKVLPREMSGDPERIARFQREARTLATLQHANIASVYGFEETAEARFLVMELVEGEDLADRLSHGPLPVAETIEVAVQIASGLDAAHEQNIVHRDLKPANVKLAPDGQVKILDFGLARAFASGNEIEGDPATSPTITAAMTQAGTILGTAAYMSPEQARGRAVDKRADVWAFGCVLYEMLSGRRAFEGETISDTLAAVLRAEPDRAEFAEDVPGPLARLLDRCLEKNPRRRLRDIGEAVILLDDLRSGRMPVESQAGAAQLPTTAQADGRRNVIWSLAVVAALALGTTVSFFLRPAPPEPILRKFTLDLGVDSPTSPSLSPDGRKLAFLQDDKLWIHSFDQLESRMLAERVNGNFRPIWSLESTDIAFASERKLIRISIAGGYSSPICDLPGLAGGAGGCWSADGRILFTIGHDHLYEVPASGGVAQIHTAVVDSVDADLHQPFLLPDGRSVLVVRHKELDGPRTISVVRDGVFTDVYALPVGIAWDPIYDPRGYLIFARRGDGSGLWALPFAPDPPRVTGEPFMVVPEAGSPSLSQDGTLVYALGDQSIAARLVTVDEQGEVLREWTAPEDGFYSLAPSPDGSKVAVEKREGLGSDIWIYDLQRGSKSRFAFGPDGSRLSAPSWSPDGRNIVYHWGNVLWARPVDASTEGRALGRGHFPSFGPKGNQVAYSFSEESSDIWVRSIDGQRDSTLVVASAADDWDGMPSPDGRFILYSSDETGKREIYLRAIGVGGGRWQVSTQGGSEPQWSVDGERIYYQQQSDFVVVDVSWEPEVRLGTPRVLFRLPAVGLQEWGRYPIRPLPEPDRFLALKLSGENVESKIAMVENWTQEF